MKLTEKAFDEIYRKYAKMIYAFVLQLCKDPVTADDIVQSTFLKAIEHADEFQGKCEVSTWLCRIARNLWLDMCKRAEQKNVPLEQIKEQHSGEEILGKIVQKEETIWMRRQIHKLPDPYKEVVMLRTLGGLSFREIGEIFEKSENWGRVTYYRAKERLREKADSENVGR
ncbi:MAG: RNA polymerase sigma factor [Eubacterium sp.]